MSTKSFYNQKAPPFGDKLYERIRNVSKHVFLIFLRSKNQNVVVYEANITNGEFDTRIPVDAYWLLLEPSYQQPRTAKGVQHDREELNFFDTTFSYGFTAHKKSAHECDFAFKNQPQDVITLRYSPHTDSVNAFIARDQRKYRIESMYVDATDNIHLFNLRDNVNRLTIFGLDITEIPYQRASVDLITPKSG